jgi:hypothetical protein
MVSRCRNVVIVAASAGALVALAGCGNTSTAAGAGPSNGGPSSSPLQTVQSAYASTIGQHSARLALVENLSVAGRHLTAKGTGVDDFAGHRLDSTITVAGQHIEVRKLGQVLYTRLPSAATSGLPGSKPWVSINLATLLKHATGSSLSQLAAGEQDDPASILAYLKQASAYGLHRAGTASIRGVETTKYTATIDLTKVAAAQGGRLGSITKSQIKALGTSTYPMSVWVDAKGLVRQFSAHLSASPTTPSVPGSGTSSSVHVDVAATIQFFDFGTPVTVSAPPASQTNDITKVVQGLAKSPLGST